MGRPCTSPTHGLQANQFIKPMKYRANSIQNMTGMTIVLQSVFCTRQETQLIAAQIAGILSMETSRVSAEVHGVQ
jgi:hypothetical protein